jgi:DNA polymerase elongation subunit (family B)
MKNSTKDRKTQRSKKMAMRRLVIDIETCPNLALVWGLWNQNVSLKQLLEGGHVLCFAAKWVGERGTQFYSIHKDGKEAMVEAAWRLLDEADAVIGYNSQRYDCRWLNSEFAGQKLSPPSPYKHIDLLKTVRKCFFLPSSKLEYVAQKFLGTGKLAHTGMDLWIECMNGDEKAWRLMERYNRQDVVLTEKLYHELLPWIPNHPNPALYEDKVIDRPTCTKCGSPNMYRNGTYATNATKYQRWRCGDCGASARERTGQMSADERKNLLTEAK